MVFLVWLQNFRFENKALSPVELLVLTMVKDDTVNASTIINQLKRSIEQYIVCAYCNNKIKSIEQEDCDYCGVEIDWDPILLPNIVKLN